MTTDHVYPEDSGTGAPEGDDVDAANHAASLQHDNLSDYKASGLSITNVDYAATTFDLTEGKCFIKDSSAATVQSGETRDQGVLFEIEAASRSGISFTDSTVNEVYIDIDLSSDDSITVNVLTSGTPSDPYLKIAEIDASNNTLTEVNDDPEVSVRDLIGTDVIGVTEIDESISPTWTSEHTFESGIEFGDLILIDNPTNERFVNAGVTTSPADGDELSYVMELNSETIVKVYAQSDGSGGIDNKELRVQGDVQATGNFTEGASL